MLDLLRCQSLPRNHLSPSCHVRSSRRGSAEEEDFDFWETNTLLRWIKDESTPLLPNNHHYSNPCTMMTLSQRQAEIVQSRREMMEMIQDMPESCYELSLKDIVDDEQQGAQGVREEETDAKETSFSFRSEEEVQIRKQKSNVKKKSSYEISRTCSSMESETFLIKMFFPIFLGSKKKQKPPGNCSSKVTLSPSLSLKNNHKDWCKIRTFFLAGVNKNSKGNNSSSSSSSRTGFSDETNTLPGCWFFFHSKKSKTKRQRGCLL